MSNKPVGLIIPTRIEAGPVMGAFGLRKGGDYYGGLIQGIPVWLAISGVGPVLARHAAEKLCARGVRLLVSAGFCGALSEGLVPGDVVEHRIASSPTPVRNRAERQALLERANAVAVDMESQAVVEAGTLHGVPIRVLRVVSDTVDDDLTPLFGSDARFSAFRIALRLLHPRTWPLAATLKRQSAIASRALIQALADKLPGW